MSTSDNHVSKLKPLVTDLNGLSKMLASDHAAVLQALEDESLPAPLKVCGMEVWRISEIKEWIAAGSPDRSTWELIKSAPKPKPAKKRFDPRPCQHDNFQIPKAGRSVLAWAKAMEITFGEALVPGMIRDGKALGRGNLLSAWDQVQVDLICMNVIRFIRGLPSYRGQFDHLFGTPEQGTTLED